MGFHNYYKPSSKYFFSVKCQPIGPLETTVELVPFFGAIWAANRISKGLDTLVIRQGQQILLEADDPGFAYLNREELRQQREELRRIDPSLDATGRVLLYAAYHHLTTLAGVAYGLYLFHQLLQP